MNHLQIFSCNSCECCICLNEPLDNAYTLAKIMEMKGNKILWNIKKRWISMINIVKCVLFEYFIFFMKMALDAPTIHSTKSNLYLLTNVETLLNFNTMMPLLEVIKFAQLRDVFVSDFIILVKICERDMYCVFYDR